MVGSTSRAAVPVAFLCANALSYALLLVAAHRMTPAAYGALSSLLGLLLIAGVPMLAVQTVVARRAATDGTTTGLLVGCAQLAGGATAILAAAAPALATFLRLDGVTGVLLVALTVPPTTALGAATGWAQGRRQYWRLAALILASTGGRSLGGIVGLLTVGGPDATIAGVLLGTGITALLALPRRVRHRLRRPGWGDAARGLRRRDAGGVLVEALHAGHAHGAFLFLTALDVLLARHLLTAHQAGVYAVGAVVTRAALWLPQSVVLLLFPALAEDGSHRATARRAMAAVGALGIAAVGGCAVLGSLVVRTVGGTRYAELDGVVWLWALLGALLAVVQLAVLAGLARRNQRRALLLWCTALADIGAAFAASGSATPLGLVAVLTGVAALAAAMALTLVLRQTAAGQAPGTKLASSPAPKRETRPDGTG